MNRSKTAARLFRDKYETQSAGLFSNKSVNSQQFSWADLIIVMEDRHRAEISKRFPDIYLRKRILSLNIPDIYQHDQLELLELLKAKFNRLL